MADTDQGGPVLESELTSLSTPMSEGEKMTAGLEESGVRLSNMPSDAYAFPKKEGTDLQTTQLDSGPQQEDAFAPVALYGGTSESPNPEVGGFPSNALSGAPDTSGQDTGALQSQIAAARSDSADDGIPDDKEARKLFDEYSPDMSQYEKTRTDQRLKAYFDNQEEIKKSKHMDYLEKLFDPKDPSASVELSNRPEVKMVTDAYKDPAAKNMILEKLKVNAYLEAVADRPLPTQAERDAFRNAWGNALTGKPTTGNTEALGLIRKEFDKRKETTAMNEEMYARAATDYIKSGVEGKAPDTLAALESFKSKYPDLITQKTQAGVYAYYDQIARQQGRIVERNRPAMETLFTLGSKALAGNADDLDIIAAQDALRMLKPADRQRALQVASMAIRSQAVDRAAGNQLMHNLYNMLNRGTGLVKSDIGTRGRATDLSLAANDIRLDAEIKALESDKAKIDAQGRIILPDETQQFPEGVGFKPTPDQKRHLLEERTRDRDNAQIMREIKANFEQNLDPYKPVLPTKLLKSLELGGYRIGEEVPTMLIGTAVSAGLGGGPAAIVSGILARTAAIQGFNYTQIKLDNPDADVAASMATAGAMATVESVIDELELGSFAGHGFKIAALRDTLRTGGAAAVMKHALKGAVETNVEEGVQDFFNEVGYAIVANLRPDMADQDIKDVLKNWVAERPEVAATLFIPNLVGAGLAGWRHVKNPDRAIYNTEILSRMGLTKEWQIKVLDEMDRDKRDVLFQEAMKHTTPESRKAAAGLLAADQAEAGYIPDDVPMATREAATNADGDRVWTIVSPEGKVLHENLDADVADQELAKINQRYAEEHLAKSALRTIEEEHAARTAETGAGMGMMDEEGRVAAATSPAVAVDFEKPAAASVPTMITKQMESDLRAANFSQEEINKMTPQEAHDLLGTTPTAAAPDAALASLQKKISANAAGKGVTVRELTPSETQSLPAGHATMTAVKALESWTGTKVRFVEDTSGSELFFHGVVDPSHPNTIWIDARGTHSTLAIFGHEFLHTLESRDKPLYNQFVKALLPHIKDITAETAKLSALHEGAIPEGKLQPEYLANVMGDALSNPDMLARLAKADPSLFEKIIQALKDWFKEFKEHAVSTFGTEGGISVDAVHNEVMHLLEKVKAQPVEETAIHQEAPTEADLVFARKAKAVARLSEHAEAERHKMEINRQAREVAAIGHYSDTERARIAGKVKEQLDKMKGVPKHGARRDAIEKEMLRQVEVDIRDKRMQNPDAVEPKTETTTGVTSPWAHVDVTGVTTIFEPKGGRDKTGFIKAVAKWKKIPFTFDKIPAGMTVSQHAENLANQMVNEFFDRLAKGGKNADIILNQIGWYENVIKSLRKEYGGFSDMFADFLGGFSPATNVEQNWKNAVGFLEQVVNGKYDALFSELHAWVESGKTIKQWRDAGKPIPLKENDVTLFGSNTNNGLAAVLHAWRLVQEGDAPKARNFTRNLIGLSVKATIDRWAARMLQRLSGGERIPIGHAESGVAGSHARPELYEKQLPGLLASEADEEIPAGGQFGFGQEVFKRAAAKMAIRDPARFTGLLPSSMQAMNWFVEKEYWSEKNWTSKEGEGGSFEEWIARQNAQRFIIGMSQAVEGHPTQPDFAPNTLQNVAFGNDLRADLVQNLKTKGEFLAVRAKDSVGMFEQKPERSLDTEILTGMKVEPMEMVRIAAKHAGAKFQKSTFVARRIKDHEGDNPNARPGIEVYFDHEVSIAEVQPIMDYMVGRGIDGFTMIVDARSRPNPEVGAGGPDKVWGVRMMHIPEYAGMTDPKEWRAEADKLRDVMTDSIVEIKKMKGVAHVIVNRYDTVVLNNGTDYDEQGIHHLSPGERNAEAWRERFFNSNAQGTTSGYGVGGEERGPAPGAPVSDRGEGRARAGPTGELDFSLKPPVDTEQAGLQPSLRPGKMAQARSEGVNRAESIQAVFEHIHGSPTRKAELLARAHRLWLKTKAEHEARQAAYQPPEVPDEAKMLQELEAHETLAHEDISAEEQAALEASSENVKERYADRISAEQDLVKRKALEREANVFAAAKRKGIEALFAERTKATKEDFTAKRNAIRQAVKQSQFASTAEGSAAIKRMQRVQTFAELNAILKSLPQEIRMKIPPTPSLEGMTQEALTEFLGKRLEQVGGAIENNLQRSFIDAIETALEKAKPKKVSGKPVKGKIGDAQSVVEMINQVKDMTPDQLATTGAAIEKQLTEASTGGEDDAAAMQRKNLLDIFGGLGDRSAADLERAHIILKAILAQGRAQWAALEAARINKQNDQANMIIAAIGAREPGDIPEMKRTEHGAVKGRMAFATGFINSHFNFAQLLKQTLPTAQLPFLDDWIERARKADGAAQDYSRKATDRLTEVIHAAAGKEGIWQTGNTIREMQQPTIKGRDRALMSKLEAIQFLLSWDQGEVADRMSRNGWTEDHINALRAGTSDQVSMAVKQFLQQEYAANWATLNPVYKAMYGIDMPRIPNYAPTRYDFTGQEEDVNVFGGAVSTSGITPGFTIGRVKHDNDLRVKDAMTVFMEHMVQTAQFVHYAQLVREMRGTLSRADVKRSLEVHMGTFNYGQLKNWLEALQRSGSNKAGETEVVKAMVGTITTAKAVSSMILNPRTWAMQIDSAFRFMAEIPATHWIQTMLDIKTYGNVAKAWNSDTIQRRVAEGMSPDMKVVMDQYKLTPTKLLTAVRLGFAPIRYLDGAFTSLSSAAVFTYHYKQQIAAGVSEADANAYAYDKMDAAVHRFSQPMNLSAKAGMLANGNSFVKLMAMFMTDPMLKTAMVWEAVGDFKAGRNRAMAVQRVMSVMAWAVLSAVIKNGYRELFTDDNKDFFDPMEWAKAAAFSPFDGLFMVGAITNEIVSFMFGTERPPKGGIPGIEHATRGLRAVKNWEALIHWDDPQKTMRELDDILKAGSILDQNIAVANALVNIAKPIVGAATIHND